MSKKIGKPEKQTETSDQNLDKVSGGHSKRAKGHDYNWRTPTTSLLGEEELESSSFGRQYSYGDHYSKDQDKSKLRKSKYRKA